MTRALDTLGQASLQLPPCSPTTSSDCAKASKQRWSSASSSPTWCKTERRDPLPRGLGGRRFAASVSLGFGALLTFGPNGLSFEAQEAIGGTLSIIAVGFVTWMIFWMARMARFMKGELHAPLDDAIGNGGAIAVFVVAAPRGRPRGPRDRPVPVGRRAGGRIVDSRRRRRGRARHLATVVVRLGSSTGAPSSSTSPSSSAGPALFLIVIAAGVLAYGVHDLQEAGILPGLHNLAFDVSATIPPS